MAACTMETAARAAAGAASGLGGRVDLGLFSELPAPDGWGVKCPPCTLFLRLNTSFLPILQAQGEGEHL